MDELRIGQAQVKLVAPEFPTDQPDLQTLLGLIYEPLLRWKNGSVTGSLLSSWQVSDEGRSWLVTMRDGACFSDGSRCTVDDIVEAVRIHQDADGPFGMGGVYAPYVSDLKIEPQNSTQIHITSPKPTGDLVDIFAAIYVGRSQDNAQSPIGTGAYKIDDYVEGEFIKLSSVDRSTDNVLFNNVTVFEISEPEARLDALVSGRVELATGFEMLEDIPHDDGIEWVKTTNTLSVTGFLNGFDEPFSDPKARLALNLAVDVETIIQDVWHGLAQPAATVVSPHHFGFPDGLVHHGYDPSRAKELFAECSMPDQLIVRTPLIIPDRAKQVVDIIQQQLVSIGVNVVVEVEEDRPKYARDVSNKLIGHMAIFDSSPLSTYRVLQEKVSSGNQGLWWQGVSDSTSDRFIDDAHLVVDTADRAQAYSRCLSWLHESPNWLYLYHPVKLYGLVSGVSGISMEHTGLVRIE